MANSRERREQRAKEAAERVSQRGSRQVEFRRAEAAELIADTLIDIRDILSDIRDSVAQINVKTK